MNKVYKVIWNKQIGVWQAVSELAKGQGKDSKSTNAMPSAKPLYKCITGIIFGLAFLPLSIQAAVHDLALPTGGQITFGQAQISQNNNSLNIKQSTQNLNTNWQSFDIGKNATVNFVQPNQSSIAVNQILDSNGSQIMGRLNANGQIFLNNPNGIIFSKTAQVNVGGLVASTLAIQEQNTKNNKDTFKLKGNASSTASVENHGTINALSGGTVALIAPNVKNTGSITTPNGVTHLTSANQVTLALQDGSLTQYQISEGVLNGLVENGGAILAENGAIYLTSKGKDSLSKSVVNHTGVLEANRVSENAKGEIILLADMQTGTTTVSGVLKAEGKNGQDGGFIETSAAKAMIANSIQVSTMSDTAQTGEWLIDPYNIVISNDTDNRADATNFTAENNNTIINATTLTTALATTGVKVYTGGSVGTQEGNITVDADLAWSSNSTLTLQADKNINLNKKITAKNGGLTLNATNTISATDAIDVGIFSLDKGNWQQNTTTLPSFNAKDFKINSGSFIRVLGGDGTTANPYQLADIYGVQGMGTKLSGNFVLAKDIDASGTVNWNSGAGFNPIGNSSSGFSGVFDGLNHRVNGLTINKSNIKNLGLFGRTTNTAYLKNIGVNNVVITGFDNLGGLVGFNLGKITNAYTTGEIKSIDNTPYDNSGGIGGLVGYNEGEIKNSYSAVNTYSGLGTQVNQGGLVGGMSGSGRISNSYATGNVTSTSSIADVGGLVGHDWGWGSISYSYATGKVTSNNTSAGYSVGGLVGLNNSYSVITNSFWNKETTGQSTSSGGTGLTTAQMFDQSNLTGFDFSSVWGNANNQTTPYLLNTANNQVFNKNDLPTGTITSTNRPVLYTAILNVNQLQNMNQNLSGKYLLGNHIDASDTVNWNSGAGFNPIGNGSSGFSGVLDGLNHTVNSLTINKPNTNYIGLFGQTAANGDIKNIGLLGGYVAGGNSLGSLVGSNYGNISNAFSSANVHVINTSHSDAGGLVGWNYGIITNTYAIGNVSAANTDSHLGGLVGYQSGGSIYNSYASGKIEGAYSGGITAGSGRVVNSFWNIEITGQSTSAGGTGLTTVQMQDLTTFINAGWDIDATGGTGKIWRIYHGQTAPLLRSFLTTLDLSTLSNTTTYNGLNQTLATVNKLSDNLFVSGGVIGGKNVGSYEGDGYYSNQQGYDLIGNTVKLTINPAALTITAKDATHVYGDTTAFAGTEFTSNGLQNGETVGQVTLASAGASATAGVNGGAPYAITASNATGGTFDASNYAITYADGKLIVTPRTLTITAKDASHVYGDTTAFAGTEFTTAGLQNKETISTVTLASTGASATAGVNGGAPYAITASNATGGTFDANNYAITYADGKLIVTPRTLTITAQDASHVYGDTTTFAGTEFTTAGLQNKETIATVTLASTGASATAGVNGGAPYAITASNATGGTFDANNYAITYADGQLIVTPKDITVTANGGSSTYGDNPLNPNLIASGLVNGEAEAVLTGLSNSFGISNTSNAGSYTLTVDGTLTNGNYNITQRNDGAWVVGKKDITVTANGGSSIYGDNPLNPNLTASGLVNNQDESVLTGLSNSFGINNASNAGSYTLTVDGTLTNGNYNITQRTDGTWIVGKKGITVTANGGTSIYGDNPMNPNLSANGLVNGETESVLTGLSNSFGITNKSNADTYTLTVDGTLTNGNYNITQRTDGTWVVGKKDITVTANGGSSIYGDNPLNPNLTAVGLVNGETESVLTGLSNSFGISNTSNAGSYILSVDGTLTNGNYNITQRTDGTWVIAKKDITVTADSLNTVYNSANQTLNGFTATGLVNGEDESILTDVKASITAKNAGTYTNKAKGAAQNYEITFVDGVLTIDKAKIQAVEGITAIDRSYDATTGVGLDTSNAQFIGLLGDDALQVVNAKGNMLDKHAAKDKVVNITHIGLAGEDAQNYVLETSTAQTQVDISKAKISDITGIQIDYHTQNVIPSQNTQIKGLFEGDDVYLQHVNTGVDYIKFGTTHLPIQSLTLAGTDVKNYDVVPNKWMAEVLNSGITLPDNYERAIQHRRFNYSEGSVNGFGGAAVIETIDGGVNTLGLTVLSSDRK